MIRIPGKIPINIYPFFWLLAVGLGFLNSHTFNGYFSAGVVPIMGTFIWTAIIFISVVVHEFGHALTAIAFGQKAHIDLIGFGGLTHRHGKKLPFWKEFLITLNGPLAGCLLILVTYLALKNVTNEKALVTQILWMTLTVNIFWTVVNLLPIQPLDGGRLLGIVLESIFGLKGVKFNLLLSVFFGVAISVFFFATQAFLAGALFLILTFESYRTWKNSLSLTKFDQDIDLQKKLREVEKDINSGHFDDAVPKLEELRSKINSGVIYVTATSHLAEIYYEQGRLKDAYDLLLPLKSQLSDKSLRILHQLAYQLKHYDVAIEIGNPVYQAAPSYETALINAISYSLLNQTQPALGWLQRAIRDGLPNLKAILSKKEFDSIRQTPQFRGFLSME